MSLILGKREVARLEDVVKSELLDAGADHVMIIDIAGNVILEQGTVQVDDILSLAVLSAANFAATEQIAKLIGEEDFTLLFHKGDKRSIHFCRMGREHILLTLFNDSVSLGLIRLRAKNAIERMLPIMDGTEGKHRWPS
jgi:predicted regulator of Ras-like GTPase activity (Roadblock/LC7/MglB family)